MSSEIAPLCPRPAHEIAARTVGDVRRKSGFLGKFTKRNLIIDLPTAPDKAAQRDGIDVKVPAHRKLGERTFWLVQMVELSQPIDWTTRFQCDAATLIEAAMATEYANELLDAFGESAKRQGDSRGYLRPATPG